jgi:hypothetical protein
VRDGQASPSSLTERVQEKLPIGGIKGLDGTLILFRDHVEVMDRGGMWSLRPKKKLSYDFAEIDRLEIVEPGSEKGAVGTARLYLKRGDNSEAALEQRTVSFERGMIGKLRELETQLNQRLRDLPNDQSAAAPQLKKCPDCLEMVQAEARICRYCRYEFFPAPSN